MVGNLTWYSDGKNSVAVHSARTVAVVVRVEL